MKFIAKRRSAFRYSAVPKLQVDDPGAGQENARPSDDQD
jgi:hypothetical protein